jgi:hypothetical protein
MWNGELMQIMSNTQGGSNGFIVRMERKEAKK